MAEGSGLENRRPRKWTVGSNPTSSALFAAGLRAAAVRGGIRRCELYGNPGTPEGRRRGGLVSVMRAQRRASHGLPAGGFRTLKRIAEPRLSSELAEFIGIMLGDGCLGSTFQASIAFNAETDREYAAFIVGLSQRLFGMTPTVSCRPHSREGVLVFSSRRLVGYLIHLGLPRANKVAIQVSVPDWITRSPQYRRSCLRGLMDTDGSLYTYQHTSHGRAYTHAALCFTNLSVPLLRFVERTLTDGSFHSVIGPSRVYLHRQREVRRYLSEIGTRNPKFSRRYSDHELVTHLWRGTQVVDGAALEKR